ncbi:O-acyltransferase like protein [Drosophila grimshawi]|uniref:GH18938 n=1 Tax=Drosophila grimshawi TaxID=7222 RepID=B4JH76_DROGR|nr:O-acyltransferase like protein [Drosophila grimshawi]EDV92767.1 GH18938 [Drosophila grimshawi]
MVKMIVTLLLFGLALVSSTQLDSSDFITMEEYKRIMEFRSLAFEFAQHYENITQTDLDIPSTRIPNQQDLQCLADMTQLTTGLASGKLWSVKMFDSWGTFPKGLLMGNIYDMGNYDECIGIQKTISDKYRIQGKYCMAKLPILKSLGIPLDLNIGICLPASCSATNMSMFLKQMLQKLIGININTQLVTEENCKTSDREPFDGLAIFTIVFLSLMGAALAVATLCDYFLYGDQSKRPLVVMAFSARANSRTLFRLVEPRTNPNVIDCLNGMRCLSLIWVIYGHQYIMALLAPTMNSISIIRWFEEPFSNLVSHAAFSVDTFLFLGGLLVVMISLRAMERTKGRLNVPLMYIHRYLRLTPILAVAILFYMTLLPHLGEGPLIHKVRFDDYSRCERTWFWTLLYLQNYATSEICISHTWYLAVDMQLYILSPIFLIALYKWGKKGAAGIFVLMLFLSGCLFTTMMTKKYPIRLQQGHLPVEAQRKLYFATHTHAAPWLLGFLFGYFLHANRNRTFKLNHLSVWLGWLISLALLFTSIFVLYPASKWHASPLSMLEQSLYYTLTRIAWPLGLCWVVFACMNGYGGMADSFLSSPLWQPLSKISYSAYIFHIVMQQIIGSRMRSSAFFSDFEMMIKFWSTFGFSVLLAFVMHLIVEAPFGVLSTMLMPSRRPTPKPENTAEIHQEAEIAKSKTTSASPVEIIATASSETVSTLL